MEGRARRGQGARDRTGGDGLAGGQGHLTGPPPCGSRGRRLLCVAASLDATCAGEGRRVFREAASGLGLTDEAMYHGMTMTSELAANTLASPCCRSGAG